MVSAGFFELRALVPAVALRQEFDANKLLLFLGEAAPGTATSFPAWRIRKFIYNIDKMLIEILWADGDGNFDNVYDDRAALTYT